MPTSSKAWNATRRATIRPVRAVQTPVVYPATPGTGAGGVDVMGRHVPRDRADADRHALAAIHREDVTWRARHPTSRTAEMHRRIRLMGGWQ